MEWVEALTIVLAVGIFKGWRTAFAGLLLALVALVVLVAGFGAAVASHLSLNLARTVIGVFLLLFGLKWLHKAILRSSGLKALHDEQKAFEETREQLQTRGGATASVDWPGAATSFNGVFLEGLEVVFIVLALGGLNSLPAASIGALASLVVIAVVGVVLRSPLTRVPENALKYVVGIMLTSFGTFFAGEGIGVQWWNADLSLLPLIAIYGLATLAFVGILRRGGRLSVADNAVVRAARAVWSEVWGLFVDDGSLAMVAIVALLGVALFTANLGHHFLAGPLLVIGIIAAIAIALGGAARTRKPTPVKHPDAVEPKQAGALSPES